VAAAAHVEEVRAAAAALGEDGRAEALGASEAPSLMRLPRSLARTEMRLLPARTEC
jgi:hypothetical protein